MKPGDRKQLVEKYRDGHRAVVEALRDISEADWDRSADDGWTPRQIIHHLADAEIIGATRLRRLLAEQSPEIEGYDEKVFTQRLGSDRRTEPALESIRWVRESTADLLDHMSEEDWSRAGRHSERGRFTMEDWLVLYAAHAHDHAAQIERARGKS